MAGISLMDKLKEEQAAQRDPFTQARQKTAREQGNESLLSSVNPFEKQPALPVEEVMSSNPIKAGSMQGLMAAGSPDPAMLKSGVVGKMKGLGLDDMTTGLSLSSMGRINLLLRLREKFGDKFFENDVARQAIAAFDSAMSTDTQAMAAADSKMFSAADRTLDELFKMSGIRRAK